MDQLDTSIPLSVKPPQIEDVASPFIRAQTLRSNQMTLDAKQREADQQQQEQAQQNAMRAALQQHADNPDDAVRTLTQQGFGEAAVKLDGMLSDVRRKKAEERMSHLNMVKTTTEMLGNKALGIAQLPSAARPAAWGTFRKSVADGLGPDVASQLPEQYSDDALDQAIAEGGKFRDMVDIQSKATTDAQAAIKMDAEKRDSADKWKMSIANALSLAGDQSHWDQVYNEYTQMGPVANNTITTNFPRTWAPEYQAAAAQMAMTPEQRAAAARSAEADRRQAASQARADVAAARSGAAADRADTRFNDEQNAFPKDVKTFLNKLPLTVKTRKQALDQVKQQWPSWVTQYPTLDRDKVNGTIDALFGKAPTGASALVAAAMGDDTADAMPDVVTPTGRASGAGPGPGPAKMQKPIPGIVGGIAESVDGGKTWKRIQ